MEMETDDQVLRTLAAGGSMDYSSWPILLSSIVARIEKIATTEFPIPVIPPSKPLASPPAEPQLLPPLASSDGPDPPSAGGSQASSQETNKENTTPAAPVPASAPAVPEAAPKSPPAPGVLPAQISTLVTDITTTLTTSFPVYPPHTIQRLSELVLYPRQHYRSLAAYLHALDRVIRVTSGSNIYPLPPAIPDMSSMSLVNGVSAHESWVNGAGIGPHHSASANLNVGSDEALGGALLTPIPWMQNRRESSGDEGDGIPSSPTTSEMVLSNQAPSNSSGHLQQGNGGRRMEGQVHTESTETIEGPNGMGHIETVSISVNGIPSHGHAAAAALQMQLHQRGPVLQGELLRAEQDAGIIPLTQVARIAAAQASHNSSYQQAAASSSELSSSPEGEGSASPPASDDEIPHARGPEEIGAADTGPQTPSSSTGSFVVGTQHLSIDVEAAVGRPAEPSLSSPPLERNTAAASQDVDPGEQLAEEAEAAAAATEQARAGTPKRGAGGELDADVPAKKLKEDEASGGGSSSGATAPDAKDVEGDIGLSDAISDPPASSEPGTAADQPDARDGS